MSNYTKFIVSKILWVTEIWWTIAILYFTRRNLDTSSALFLISIYSISIVLLEYPTWLVADTYWHKSSALLWFITLTVWFILLSFNLPFYWYVLGLILLACGKSLKSWSMTAILNWITSDFKSHHIQVSTLESMSKFFMAVVSWYIFLYNPILVVIIASILSGIGWVIFYTIPYVSNSQEGNIYSTAIKWFTNIFKSKLLISLLIVFSVTAWYRQNIKHYITSMWDYFPVSVLFMTRAVWWHSLFRALWAYSVRFLNLRKSTILAIVVIVLMVFAWGNHLAILIWFILLSGLFQNIETNMEVEIVNTIDKNVIATVLSTFELWHRLSASIMLLIAWYTLKLYSYQTMYITTSWIVILGILIYSIIYYKNRKS